MKSKTPIVFLTSIILLFNNCNQAQTKLEVKTNDELPHKPTNDSNITVQSQDSDEHVINIIKAFYTSYITEASKMPTPENVANQKTLKKKYCSEKLLNKLEKEDLDYDPFLKAQDSNIEWLKTLAVNKDQVKQNVYAVSFTDTYNNSVISINLTAVKFKDSYQIDSIW